MRTIELSGAQICIIFFILSKTPARLQVGNGHLRYHTAAFISRQQHTF